MCIVRSRTLCRSIVALEWFCYLRVAGRSSADELMIVMLPLGSSVGTDEVRWWNCPAPRRHMFRHHSG